MSGGILVGVIAIVAVLLVLGASFSLVKYA